MATQLTQSFRHIAGVADKAARLEAQSEMHGFGFSFFRWLVTIKLTLDQSVLAGLERLH